MNRNKKGAQDVAASPYPTRSRSNSITVAELADEIMSDEIDVEESQRTESETPGSVSINLLKELMSRVTSNINAQMERMLGSEKTLVKLKNNSRNITKIRKRSRKELVTSKIRLKHSKR